MDEWRYHVVFLAAGWMVVLKTLRSEPLPHRAVYTFLWLYAPTC